MHFFDISTSKSGPTMVCFVHFDVEMCFAPQRRALFRHLNCQKWSGPGVFCTFSLRNVLRATTTCTFSTSQLPKMVRQWCALYIFVHFHFEMCFAPQRRALFRHLNCQKWSGPGVFCTFSLRNVLRATTACTFSTSQLPKVVWPWCILYILTWKCASRHNGVQFFISHLASWLRTRRFSEPTFRPSGATNHWKKHSVSRLSYLFAHLHLLSSDSFSSTLLSSNLSLLSASSLLCFSSAHIVGSLTSKLPSINFNPMYNIFDGRHWMFGCPSQGKTMDAPGEVCRVLRAAKRKGHRLSLSVNTDFKRALQALREHHEDQGREHRFSRERHEFHPALVYSWRGN